MRTFEIPSMGGLMLTKRTEEQQEFFPEGKACYMYENGLELADKIAYILNNEQEANKVRIYGQTLAKVHSYTNRAKFLLNELLK